MMERRGSMSLVMWVPPEVHWTLSAPSAHPASASITARTVMGIVAAPNAVWTAVATVARTEVLKGKREFKDTFNLPTIYFF